MYLLPTAEEEITVYGVVFHNRIKLNYVVLKLDKIRQHLSGYSFQCTSYVITIN